MAVGDVERLAIEFELPSLAQGNAFCDGDILLKSREIPKVAERRSVGRSVFTEAGTETIPLARSPLLPPVPANKRTRASNELRHAKRAPASLDFLVDERELQVRRELHALELAAATSIVRHGTAIDVEFAPTSIEQEQTLFSALGKIPGANVTILSAKAAVLHSVTAGTQPSAAPANGKPGEARASKWLKPILGSESEVHAEEERRLQIARHLVSLAGEWRLLAERYPISIEPHLSSQADSILREIVADLRTRIQQEIHNEQLAINDLLRHISVSPARTDSNLLGGAWQSQAVPVADLLWENEQAIEQFYAPASSGGGTMPDTDILLRLHALTDSLASLLRVSSDRK